MLRPSRYFTESSSAVERGDLVHRLGQKQDVLGHGSDLLQPVGVALDGAVLVVERFTQHGPAAVDLADAVPVVDPHVAVVGDVGAVTVDGAERLDLDAGRVQRNQKHREALVLRRIRIGVGDQVDVGGVMRIGGEHLGAVDDPPVAVADRTGLTGRDVGAAFGLGIAQAQPEMPRQRARQHLLLQFG